MSRPAEVASDPKGRWITRYLNHLFLAAGLIFLVALVVELGAGRILDMIYRTWGAVLASMGILVVGLVLGGFAWWLLIPAACRPSRWRIFPAHFAGYSMNRLLPTGNLGELSRLNLLGGVVPLQELTASLVVFNILGSLTGLALTTMGSLVAMFAFPFPAWVGSAMLLVSLGLTAAMVGLLIVIRLKLLGRLEAFLRRLPGLRRLAGYLRKAQRIDEALAEVAHLRRLDTWKATLLLALVRLTHVLSSTVVLASLLPNLGAARTFLLGLVLITASQVLSWVFAMLPSGVGVVEGGSAFLVHALGIDAGVGFSSALCQRIAGLALATLGLLGFPLTPRQSVPARGR